MRSKAAGLIGIFVAAVLTTGAGLSALVVASGQPGGHQTLADNKGPAAPTP